MIQTDPENPKGPLSRPREGAERAAGREGIGAAVLRREDRRFLAGEGRYVADLNFEHQLHCAFVRSPHAHARVRALDLREALAAPGVAAVLTGADMEADRV
jgi:carbon-monoxide dehydrogenase large subunit